VLSTHRWYTHVPFELLLVDCTVKDNRDLEATALLNLLGADTHVPFELLLVDCSVKDNRDLAATAQIIY
jgi:hypothetical protein